MSDWRQACRRLIEIASGPSDRPAFLRGIDLAALRQLSSKSREWPSATMPDMKNLHDVTFDRKQNPVHVRPTAIKKLTNFSW